MNANLGRSCAGCGANIDHRAVDARYCGSRGCYMRVRWREQRDEQAHEAAEALAARAQQCGLVSTVVRTDLHGWCIRSKLHHGPETFFIDDDDLTFYLREREASAA